jgi:hypothetical protein
MWALADPNEQRAISVVFEVYGTGQVIGDMSELRFVATVQDGKFVWHIFERVLAR